MPARVVDGVQFLPPKAHGMGKAAGGKIQIIDALKPEPEPSVAPASQGKRKMGAGSKKKAKMSGP